MPACHAVAKAQAGPCPPPQAARPAASRAAASADSSALRALGEPAAQEPVPGHRARQAQRQVRLAMPDRAIECATDIGGLAVETLEPLPLAVAAQLGAGLLGERGVELGGAPAGTGQARPPRAAAPCHRPRPTRAAGSGAPVRPRRSPRPATGPPGGPAGRRRRPAIQAVSRAGLLGRRPACSRRHGPPAGAARPAPAR